MEAGQMKREVFIFAIFALSVCTPIQDTSNEKPFLKVGEADSPQVEDIFAVIPNNDAPTVPNKPGNGKDEPDSECVKCNGPSVPGPDVFTPESKQEKELLVWYSIETGEVVVENYFLFCDVGPKAVFFTGIVNAPYVNIEQAGILNFEKDIAYIPAPLDLGPYYLFNLMCVDDWFLVAPNTKPGKGLKIFCTENSGCAFEIIH